MSIFNKISCSGKKNIAPLSRWKSALIKSPSTAVIVGVGDSTIDETTAALSFWKCLRNKHTLEHGALSGMVGDTDHIVGQGHNGMSLATWLADDTVIPALAAKNPSLVIFSFGINDVRLGETTLSEMISLINQAIIRIQIAVPSADILLRVPATFTTTNTNSYNYIQNPIGTINPAGASQTFSKILRDAYLYFNDRSGVTVFDSQAEIFGTSSISSNALMADQIHPSIEMTETSNHIPLGGGYVALADAVAKFIGLQTKPFAIDKLHKTPLEFGICASAGSGYIDIFAPYNQPGENPAQFPITTADVLYIPGIQAPISLLSATIYRPFSSTNIRILVTGDYTAAIGRSVYVGSDHPKSTTGDRQIVSVDLPSIAAGDTIGVTVPITGAATGDLHNAVSVIATPPAAFVSSGLLLLNCYPTANNTVTIVVHNNTGSSVDLGSSQFTFWVIR